LQSAAMLWIGDDCCGAAFCPSLPSLHALGAVAPALDCSSCSELASWCREDGAGDPRGLTAPTTGGERGKDGTQSTQQTWSMVESSGRDAALQLVPAQLGEGVQGAMLVDHCPLLHLKGDFQAGTSPGAAPQGWEGGTAIQAQG